MLLSVAYLVLLVLLLSVNVRVLAVRRYLEYDVLKEFGDRVCFITPDVAHFIKLHDGECNTHTHHSPLSLAS